MGTVGFNKYESALEGKLSQINFSKKMTPRLRHKGRVRIAKWKRAEWACLNLKVGFWYLGEIPRSLASLILGNTKENRMKWGWGSRRGPDIVRDSPPSTLTPDSRVQSEGELEESRAWSSALRVGLKGSSLYFQGLPSLDIWMQIDSFELSATVVHRPKGDTGLSSNG